MSVVVQRTVSILRNLAGVLTEGRVMRELPRGGRTPLAPGDIDRIQRVLLKQQRRLVALATEIQGGQAKLPRMQAIRVVRDGETTWQLPVTEQDLLTFYDNLFWTVEAVLHHLAADGAIPGKGRPTLGGLFEEVPALGGLLKTARTAVVVGPVSRSYAFPAGRQLMAILMAAGILSVGVVLFASGVAVFPDPGRALSPPA